ncbi:MAG: formylmethanofuran dehydrogenase subunit B [Gemmataceae bacterium]
MNETRRVVSDVPCTVCGCVCDDLRLTIEDNRIVQAERACRLAEPWLLGQGQRRPPVAQIEGRTVALDEALARAAAILGSARSPLIYGLSRSNTTGQRAALALAERLGATVDTTASRGHAPSILALQECGESTCTLGEVRNRADLVIFWGSDPVESHPRHLERYALEATGLFVPQGRRDRQLVVVDVKPTATSALADRFVQVQRGSDFDLLWALRGALRGIEPTEAVAGVPADAVRALAESMRTCRCGMIFFGLGLARNGMRTVEALLRLGIDLNRHTRFYVRRMRVSGDVAGADSVLAWQTGFPFAVNLGRNWPRYNPGEFTGPDMLARNEVDACLFVGGGGVRRFEPAARAALAQVPTILLDGPDAEPLFTPTVRFVTAVPGIHLAGTVYRMDEVPIEARAVLSCGYPTDASLLGALQKRLTGQGKEP